MKKIILGTVLALSSILANDIKVEVTDILNHNGKISIGLYNKNDDTFANMSKYYKGVYLKIAPIYFQWNVWLVGSLFKIRV